MSIARQTAAKLHHLRRRKKRPQTAKGRVAKCLEPSQRRGPVISQAGDAPEPATLSCTVCGQAGQGNYAVVGRRAAAQRWRRHPNRCRRLCKWCAETSCASLRLHVPVKQPTHPISNLLLSGMLCFSARLGRMATRSMQRRRVLENRNQTAMTCCLMGAGIVESSAPSEIEHDRCSLPIRR